MMDDYYRRSSRAFDGRWAADGLHSVQSTNWFLGIMITP